MARRNGGLFSCSGSASQPEKCVLEYATSQTYPCKQAAKRLACYSFWRDEASANYSGITQRRTRGEHRVKLLSLNGNPIL